MGKINDNYVDDEKAFNKIRKNKIYKGRSGEFIVLDKYNDTMRMKIKFLDSSNTRYISLDQFLTNNVVDNNGMDAGFGYSDGYHKYYNYEIWKLWQDILRRCKDPSHNEFHIYGGRGYTLRHADWEHLKPFMYYCNTCKFNDDPIKNYRDPRLWKRECEEMCVIVSKDDINN